MGLSFSLLVFKFFRMQTNFGWMTISNRFLGISLIAKRLLERSHQEWKRFLKNKRECVYNHGVFKKV